MTVNYNSTEVSLLLASAIQHNGYNIIYIYFDVIRTNGGYNIILCTSLYKSLST